MITCKDCKHYVTAVCAECKGFDKVEFDNVVYTVTDNINRPAHYANRKFETIDVIEDWTQANELDGVQGYLYGSLIKYLSRFNCKGHAIEDLKKAQYFLNRLIEVREHEKVHG